LDDLDDLDDGQNDYLYFFQDQPYFIDGFTDSNARLGMFTHTGEFITSLSPSGYDVQQVYGYNSDSHLLFMSVAIPALERHVYSASVDFTGKPPVFDQKTQSGGYYRACTYTSVSAAVLQ
jgi:hypothetical protein